MTIHDQCPDAMPDATFHTAAASLSHRGGGPLAALAAVPRGITSLPRRAPSAASVAESASAEQRGLRRRGAGLLPGGYARLGVAIVGAPVRRSVRRPLGCTVDRTAADDCRGGLGTRAASTGVAHAGVRGLLGLGHRTQRLRRRAHTRPHTRTHARPQRQG